MATQIAGRQYTDRKYTGSPSGLFSVGAVEGKRQSICAG